MHPAELWRHSLFRLALGVALFVLATLTLAGGIGFGLMQAQLTARQDARIAEIFSAIKQTSQQGDETDLIETIDARVEASPDHSTVYLLRDAKGKRLAGNIDDIALPTGWSSISASRLGVATDYPYRMYSAPVGEYAMIVGLTDADLDDLRELILGAFGWASFIALSAAIGAGLVLAWRVQRRIANAEAAAACVAAGDLTARLPVSTRGDDLDRISVAINTALERLEGLVEAMRQVSADIAHELRTPLNRVRIHIEDAVRKARTSGSIERDLEMALAESERLNGTFTALLRIAQIETGARREKFSPVDLSAIASDVVDVYTGVAEDSGQKLEGHFSRPVWVMGDRDLLVQALSNLIENAIRHCSRGTTITCGVNVIHTDVNVFVSDTGPGIPDDERQKVLRRFYRLERGRTPEGTGLGLALVKAVSDLHGAKFVLSDARPGLRAEMIFRGMIIHKPIL